MSKAQRRRVVSPCDGGRPFTNAIPGAGALLLVTSALLFIGNKKLLVAMPLLLVAIHLILVAGAGALLL